MISKKLLVVCLTPFIFETNVILAGEAPSEPVVDTNVVASNPPATSQDNQDTNIETPINNAADMQAMFDDTRMDPVMPASTQNPPAIAQNTQGANAETPIDNAADMRAMFGNAEDLGNTSVPPAEVPINEVAPPPPPPAPITSNPNGDAKWVDSGQRDIYGNIIYSRAPTTAPVATPTQDESVLADVPPPPPAPQERSAVVGSSRWIDSGQKDEYGNTIYYQAPKAPVAPPPPLSTSSSGNVKWIDSGRKDEYGNTIYYRATKTPVAPPPPLSTSSSGNVKWINFGRKDEYGNTIYEREGREAKPSVENEADRIAKEAEERLKAETKAAEEAAVAAKSADRKAEELNEKVDTLTLEIAGLRESLGGGITVANEEPKVLLGADGKEISPTIKNPDEKEVPNPEYEKALVAQQGTTLKDIATEGSTGNSSGKTVENEGQTGQTSASSEKAQVGADLQKVATSTESVDPDGLATAGQIDGVNAKLDALLKAQSVELQEQDKLEKKVDAALSNANASTTGGGNTSSAQSAATNQETTKQTGGASVAAESLPSAVPTGNVENGNPVVTNAGAQSTVGTFVNENEKPSVLLATTSSEILPQEKTSVEPVGTSASNTDASALTESPAAHVETQKLENSKDAGAPQQPTQVTGSSESDANKAGTTPVQPAPNVSLEKSGEPKEAASSEPVATPSEEDRGAVASQANPSDTGALATKIIDSLQQLKRVEEALSGVGKAG